MSVVSFRASRQMVFFTGAVVQNDLLKLAEAVGEPLYRGLAATESAGARPNLDRVPSKISTRSISESGAALSPITRLVLDSRHP